MEETEFDRFAEEYAALHTRNITLSGETPEFFAAYKVADTAEVLSAKGLADAPRILDFGAGVGTSVVFFREHFPTAKLTCLDVSRKSLELGETRYGDLAEFVHFDGRRIPSPIAVSISCSWLACFTTSIMPSTSRYSRKPAGSWLNVECSSISSTIR